MSDTTPLRLIIGCDDAGWSGANDDDVIFHRFSGHDSFPLLCPNFSYAAIYPFGQLLQGYASIC